VVGTVLLWRRYGRRLRRGSGPQPKEVTE
jgi:hypothetical protein